MYRTGFGLLGRDKTRRPFVCPKQPPCRPSASLESIVQSSFVPVVANPTVHKSHICFLTLSTSVISFIFSQVQASVPLSTRLYGRVTHNPPSHLRTHAHRWCGVCVCDDMTRRWRLLELHVLIEHRRGRGLGAVPAPPAAERVGHGAGQAAAVVFVCWVKGGERSEARTAGRQAANHITCIPNPHPRERTRPHEKML